MSARALQQEQDITGSQVKINGMRQTNMIVRNQNIVTLDSRLWEIIKLWEKGFS